MKPLLFALAVATGAAAQPLPQVTTGRIERLEALASAHVTPRPVDVWLPADYSPTKRYQVLYVHDGQMLFYAGTTWNRQAWNVHLAVDRLVRSGRIADTITRSGWRRPARSRDGSRRPGGVASAYPSPTGPRATAPPAPAREPRRWA